jgi:hypothetical protein
LLFGGIILPLQNEKYLKVKRFEKDCIIISSFVGGKRNPCHPEEVNGSGETTTALGAGDGNGAPHK